MQRTGRSDNSAAIEGAVGVVASIDRAIRDAFIHLDALDRRALAGIAPSLTPAQYHALAALALAPAQNLNELAAHLLCDKSNASGLIDRLVTQGLVDRARDPVDGRRVRLSLTPLGQDVLARAAHLRMTALLRALTPLELPGLTTLTQHLAHLVSLLQTAATATEE